jgi:hypothetical protein
MEEMQMNGLVETVERLSAAACALEQAVATMVARQESFAVEAEATVGRIVATVETAREEELERKLAAAEARIAELTASAAGGRKTLPGGVGRMLAKEGIALESLEAGTIDAALTSLNVEQRIAVKAALLRSGMVG